MTVVHPGRDAGLVGPHGLDDELRERREGQRDAAAEQRGAGVQLPRLVVRDGEEEKGSAGPEGAEDEGRALRRGL